MTPGEASSAIIRLTPLAFDEINKFSREVLRTRGGRVGSGMGILLEAMWGYYVNRQFAVETGPAQDIEMSWLIGHEYNDFACVLRNQEWKPDSRLGELLRVEAKSMNIDADEPKGHFEELAGNLGAHDLLVIPLWVWKPVEGNRIYPGIRDHFVGPARPIAELRDRLHLARGGTFVDRDSCPDECVPAECLHHGEPLNADGKRERASGPASRKPANSSFAGNFGGLVRMLKTSTDEARREFGRIRAGDDVAHSFISFIHRNNPDEESNQYLSREWVTAATEHGVNRSGYSKGGLIERIREDVPDYQDVLRRIRAA